MFPQDLFQHAVYCLYCESGCWWLHEGINSGLVDCGMGIGSHSLLHMLWVVAVGVGGQGM